MFSEKRSFWRRRWFAITIAGLLVFGYWINQLPEDLTEPESLDRQASIQKSTIKNQGNGNQKNSQQGSAPEEDTEDVSNRTPYYLIKETDQVISIYYCDETGKETLVQNTDIAFALLCETDQALFSKGIIRETEEELEELLQDFGS